MLQVSECQRLRSMLMFSWIFSQKNLWLYQFNAISTSINIHFNLWEWLMVYAMQPVSSHSWLILGQVAEVVEKDSRRLRMWNEEVGLKGFWCFLIANTMVLGDKSYGIARIFLLYVFSGHGRLTASIHHWIGTALRSAGDGCAQPLGTPTDNWYITTITNYSIHH